MAHFAQLNSNNTVLQVIVVGNDDITDGNGNERVKVLVFLSVRTM